MDFSTASDPTALAELQAVRGILAGVTVPLDEIERAMPPAQCVWTGTAFEAYYRNIDQLFLQVAALTSNLADARAAISGAISAL